MMFLPCRSSARALFRTSKAVSVPSRDIRRASCKSYCVVCAMTTKLLRSQTAHYTLGAVAGGRDEPIQQISNGGLPRLLLLARLPIPPAIERLPRRRGRRPFRLGL